MKWAGMYKEQKQKIKLYVKWYLVTILTLKTYTNIKRPAQFIIIYNRRFEIFVPQKYVLIGPFEKRIRFPIL